MKKKPTKVAEKNIRNMQNKEPKLEKKNNKEPMKKGYK
jgi:hypothetical protein